MKGATDAKPVAEDWLLWGGKNRDFLTNASGLADSWPAAGPKKLWSRALGDGYSAIAEENGVLYTAFRRASKDVVTALEAATGKTVWEYEYDNPFTNAYSEGVGPGPYAMPQVIGDRVVMASGTGKIHSLDKKTGKSHLREMIAANKDLAERIGKLEAGQRQTASIINVLVDEIDGIARGQPKPGR